MDVNFEALDISDKQFPYGELSLDVNVLSTFKLISAPVETKILLLSTNVGLL